MTSFGDHEMDIEVRDLADQYAAAMGQALTEVQAAFSARPREDVRNELSARLFAANVPVDQARRSGIVARVQFAAGGGPSVRLKRAT